jgi:hypothetical protein
MTAKDRDIEHYIDLAKQHGEDSDPDHEVGDLQTFLREAWAILSPTQRVAFRSREAVRSTAAAASMDDEDVVEALGGAEPNSHSSGDQELLRVCVFLEGGNVSGVVANTNILVNVVDYDVDDDDPDAVLLEQDSGGDESCSLWEINATIEPKWFERIDSAQAAPTDDEDAGLSP